VFVDVADLYALLQHLLPGPPPRTSAERLAGNVVLIEPIFGALASRRQETCRGWLPGTGRPARHGLPTRTENPPEVPDARDCWWREAKSGPLRKFAELLVSRAPLFLDTVPPLVVRSLQGLRVTK